MITRLDVDQSYSLRRATGLANLTIGSSGNTGGSILQSNANQTISAGSIQMTGGAGTNSLASIQANGTQTLTVGGALNIQGGTGNGTLGQSGTATIQNNGAGQIGRAHV